MKAIFLIPAALLLIAAPVDAQKKKQDPYMECKKSGRSEQDCRQYMDPHLRKSLEFQEETMRKSAAHLEEQKRKDQMYQKDGRWR